METPREVLLIKFCLFWFWRQQINENSVKKTTNEQFDLLKSEMSVHLAAARGYGMGADRATVDAEWREIVEKLNAIGPPHRSLTEWKKVIIVVSVVVSYTM